VTAQKRGWTSCNDGEPPESIKIRPGCKNENPAGLVGLTGLSVCCSIPLKGFLRLNK